MDLTRTERLILETAAEMFDFEIGPARAATMTEIELTSAERQEFNGDRAQLGELLVKRGWLTTGQLERVLDRVYGEIQSWSDRLSTPAPPPVPRPVEEGSPEQLAELVRQLTALLDLLIGDGSGLALLPHQAPAAAQAQLARTLIEDYGGLGDLVAQNTIVGPGEEDDDTKDFMRLPDPPSPEEEDDTKDFGTMAVERSTAAPALGTLQVQRSEAVEEGPGTLQVQRPEPVEEGPGTLQVQRDELEGPGTLQVQRDELEGPGTLQVQRDELEPEPEPEPEPVKPAPAPTLESFDDLPPPKVDTLHVERGALERQEAKAKAKWTPPSEDDTAQIERPEGAVRDDASDLTTGDTVHAERAEVGNAD